MEQFFFSCHDVVWTNNSSIKQIFTLENNEAHFLWQSVGCQLSVLDSDSLGSVDWSK